MTNTPPGNRIRRYACAMSVLTLGCNAEAVPCALPEVPRGGVSSVIEIENHPAFSANVFFEDDRFHAYVPSFAGGEGAVYLSYSSDGLHWETPRRVVKGESAGAFVLPTEFGFRMWLTSWPTSIVARDSRDGIHWGDTREVFTRSSEPGPDGALLDDDEIGSPTVWYDGTTWHLYFSGYSDRAILDVTNAVSSIGHAVSSDGERFQFANWVFPSTSCDGEPAFGSSLRLTGYVRPACARCEVPGVVLLAQGEICGDSKYRMYSLASEDGYSFGVPERIPGLPFDGTVLLSPDRAVRYHVKVGEASSVSLRGFNAERYGVSCAQ